MPLKHLEHEGNEDFEKIDVTNKEEADKVEEIQEFFSSKVEELKEEQRLIKAQEEYMKPNNPLLWDGDF